MSWHSIHVHYYDPDLDRLLLEAVRPFFEQVRPLVTTGYFQRHWRRGPHLRLVLRTDPGRFGSSIYPAAKEVIGGYLARYPSRADPDPQQLLPLHRRLAELEQEDGPLLPWRPDNSLHAIRHDHRLGVLGSRAAADLQARFLAATTGVAFRMLDQVRAHGQRQRLGFDLLVALAHALGGGTLLDGAVSYRSHAEAFLSHWPEGIGRRRAWDRYYRCHASELVERVGAVIRTVDQRSATVPFVTEWVDLLAAFRDHGRELIRAGTITLDPSAPAEAEALPAEAEVDAVPLPAPPPPLSEFHRALAANRWWQQQVRPSAGFAAHRLVLNYQYLHLTRLGITPVERMLLCHLAANAAEEDAGRSILDLVRPPRGQVPAAHGGRT